MNRVTRFHFEILVGLFLTRRLHASLDCVNYFRKLLFSKVKMLMNWRWMVCGFELFVIIEYFFSMCVGFVLIFWKSAEYYVKKRMVVFLIFKLYFVVLVGLDLRIFIFPLLKFGLVLTFSYMSLSGRKWFRNVVNILEM